MGVIFGLLAALGWGTGDFVLSRINRTLGPAQTMLYVQAAGIVTSGLILLARSDAPPREPGLWLLAFAVNLFNLGGTALLYRALAVGTLAVVSPIAASFAAVTAVLALTTGERLEPLALGGVGLVMAGVVVVSRAPGADRTSLRGVPAALGAACCYGFFFWLLSPVTDGLGIIWPVMVSRIVAAVAVLLFLSARGTMPAPLPRRLWGAVTLATTLDTLGFLAYNLGIATAYVSVVTALASIFSAVTVLMARVLLREHLASIQWIGVGAVLIGVLLVSA